MEGSPDLTGRMVVTNMWRSRTGWILVAIYLIAAFFLFWDALTCVGVDCDLRAWPVFVPAGLAYYAGSNFLLGYAPATPIEWRLITPSILTNVILYYFVGYLIGRFAIRFRVRKMWQSKTGWAFAAAYMIAVFVLFWNAFTCMGMLCDLPAVFVFAPAGLAYYPAANFLFGYIIDPFREWGLIIPSVLTNVTLYYYVGYLIGWVARGFLDRKKPPD